MREKEKKFQQIITEFQDMIYRLCCAYVENSEIRKDLYQNILLRVWKGLDSFNQRSRLSTWIYRVAVNTSLDFLRAEKKRKRTPDTVDIYTHEMADKDQDPEKKLIISEQTRRMYACIGMLSFIDRTIVSLYLEGLSYSEIADIIGITEKNLSVKLTRLKKNLIRCLKDF